MSKFLFTTLLAVISASFTAHANDYFVSINVLDSQKQSLSIPLTLIATEPAGYKSDLEKIPYPVKECSSSNGKITERFYGKEFKRGYAINFSSGLPDKEFKVTEYLIDDKEYPLYDFKKDCFANQVVQIVNEYSFTLNVLQATSKIVELQSGGEVRIMVHASK